MTRMTEEEQEEQEEQDGADTPQEQEPRTDIDRQAPSAKRLPSAKRRQAPSDALVNGSLILAEFPSEVLVHLAEMLGNPLTLLVSKAHLSKVFCEAARTAQATLLRMPTFAGGNGRLTMQWWLRWSQSAPSCPDCPAEYRRGSVRSRLSYPCFPVSWPLSPEQQCC